MKQPMIVKRLLSRIPTRLPIGMTEFNAYAADVIELAGPVADENSMRWVIAANMIDLKKEIGYVPKSYFVNRLYNAAASQVSSQVIQDIAAAKDAEKQAALVPTPPVEDTTAQPTVVENESVPQ